MLNEASGMVSGSFIIDNNIPSLPKMKMNETARQVSDTAPFKVHTDLNKPDAQSLLDPARSLDSPLRLNQDSARKFDGTLREGQA